jgi:putative transposase
LPGDLQRELPRMELVWADGAYTGGFRRWAKQERGWRVEVAHHPDRQLWRYGLEEKPRGLRVLPRRWMVERTFSHGWGCRDGSARTTKGCPRVRRR